MKNLMLTQLKRKEESLQEIDYCASDSESFGTKNAKFRCGSIAYFNRKYINNKLFLEKKVEVFFDINKYFERLLQFNLIFFFNLGYDSNYLRNYLFEKTNFQEFQICSGNKILGIKIKKDNYNSILVKDIFPFSQNSLEESCKEYFCKTTKYNVDFDNCSDKEIKKHNENDSLMLLELIYNMRKEMFNNFKIDMLDKSIYSPPSYFMKVYRSQLKKDLENPFFLVFRKQKQKDIIIVNEELWNYCKLAYKGGYCNVISNKYYTNIYSLDICSAYPFASQMINFPIGKAIRTTSYNEFKQKTKWIFGICTVKIQINKLGVICGNRNGKLRRLLGNVRETLTSLELEIGLSNGVILIDFIEGIYFENYDKTHSFRKYCWNMYKLKCISENGKRSLSKLGMNALTGKFCQDYKQTSLKVEYIRDKNKFLTESLDSDVIHHFETLNGGILYREFISEKPKGFMMLWTIYINAYIRCYLLSQPFSIYYDSDSLKLLEEHLNLMKNTVQDNKIMLKDFPEHSLGMFDIEYKIEEIRCLAPKCYAYSYYKNNELKKVVKCKGIPKEVRKNLYKDIIEGKTEIITNEYIKIMSPTESFISKNESVISKSGIFGGIRITSKRMNPKPKEEEWLSEF